MRDLSDVLRDRHLRGLDGLRAIAVLVVMTYHFAPEATRAVPGDLGVTLFFVLSGFLITWLLRKEWNRTAGISFRRFYLRRTLRIFPAYYVFLAFTGALMLALHRSWPHGQGWAAALYVEDYYGATHLGGGSSSIAHTWSLAVEEQFYLLWPLCFLALAKRGRRALLVALGTTICAVLAWRLWLVLGLGVGPEWPYHAFDSRADSLAIGCFLAVALETGRGVRLAAAAAKWTWLPLLTVTGILASRASAIHGSAGYTIEALLCGILIVQILQLVERRTWRWLEHPVPTHLGRISYPLYLYHGLPLVVAARLPVPAPIRLIVGMLGAVALASTSYYFVERPALKLKERLSARATPPLLAEAA